MIPLIAPPAILPYRAAGAMKTQADCIAVLRRLLEPPSPGTDDLARAMEAVRMPRDAAEQMALFADRTGDLTDEERQELFDETFDRNAAADADRQRILQCLAADSAREPAGAAELTGLLQRLRTQLLRDGNPYHHLIAAAQVLIGA
jgi:nitrate reductase assembly molybdenum cofactor insertion protein NarJ